MLEITERMRPGSSQLRRVIMRAVARCLSRSAYPERSEREPGDVGRD